MGRKQGVERERERETKKERGKKRREREADLMQTGLTTTVSQVGLNKISTATVITKGEKEEMIMMNYG